MRIHNDNAMSSLLRCHNGCFCNNETCLSITTGAQLGQEESYISGFQTLPSMLSHCWRINVHVPSSRTENVDLVKNLLKRETVSSCVRIWLSVAWTCGSCRFMYQCVHANTLTNHRASQIQYWQGISTSSKWWSVTNRNKTIFVAQLFCPLGTY